MFLSVGFNRAPGIFLSFGSYVGYDPALLVLTFTGFVNAHVLAPLHQNTRDFLLICQNPFARHPPKYQGGFATFGRAG